MLRQRVKYEGFAPLSRKGGWCHPRMRSKSGSDRTNRVLVARKDWCPAKMRDPAPPLPAKTEAVLASMSSKQVGIVRRKVKSMTLPNFTSSTGRIKSNAIED